MTNLAKLIKHYFIIVFFTFSACTEIDSSGGSPTGVWQRYNSPKGYKTDLAIGNIPGEPENRVYMCEHPGSPTSGLYKGYINGNTISWDPSHGLPDADFNEVGGGERTLYFGVGAVSDAGKYKKGVWTNTCGELKKTSKRIFYRWTEDLTCPPLNYSVVFKHPDLPSSLEKHKYYGPISAGFVYTDFTHNGLVKKQGVTLIDPPEGYKRLYTNTTYSFNTALNRCTFSWTLLTYVDQPL